MSYIQFESGREKDKARQELREARAELLQQAKERAEERNKREIQKELRGESNWMLPAISNKLDKLSKSSSTKSKKSSKKKSKHKSKSKALKSKKSSKKRRKKNKHSSSSSESSSDSDSDSSSSSSSSSSNSSSSVDRKQRRRNKKSKKCRNKNDNNSDEWVERVPVVESVKPGENLVQRDSWMTDSAALMLKTYTKERKEPSKANEKVQQIDAYDPAKCKYELNPYWKSNGTGLPGFQKPNTNDDLDGTERADRGQSSALQPRSSARNWQKPSTAVSKSRRSSNSSRKRSSSDASSSAESAAHVSCDESPKQVPKQLTDEQINDLASRAIKAELKGNTQLASDLNQQLAKARNERAELLASSKTPAAAKNTGQSAAKQNQDQDHVLLTCTDASGNVRPLVQSRTAAAQLDPNSLYGGRRGQKRNKKKVDTHENGERVRYFADDDRYDIKQMFEREKHATAADSNLQYADIVSKHKNPNDDLEDIFADKVRQNISEADAEKRELQKAIREHQKLTATLDNCERCFDSTKLDKQLLVSMGDKIYMSLPWHVGLQSGHCILTSMQHVSACTQLDEDAWEELCNFRKALTRMFAAQRKDVVFYEIANKLHRRPHLTVHCIPIPESRAEMAPFYFKKAIEESEQEWCINKQLISLRKKSLRASIPKGLPYLWINFGMDSGFAHVIEDQDRFPANFAQEILGGMLELNPNTWRKPRKESNPMLKVKSFADGWRKYDCTEH